MLDCPAYITALLRDIEQEMSRQYWNKYQIDFDEDDPFGNTGNVEGFDNGVFEGHAYDWSWDVDELPEPINFKYKDIEIIWYKYLGRGIKINREISPDEAVEMYNTCMFSLEKGWNNKNKDRLSED